MKGERIKTLRASFGSGIVYLKWLLDPVTVKPLQCSWSNIISDSISWVAGSNVQPNCCKILVGARSCPCAWDAGCCVQGDVEGLQPLVVKGVSSKEGQIELLFVTDTQWLQCSQLLLHVPHVPWETWVLYCLFTFPGVCACSWEGLSLSDKLLSCSAQAFSFTALPLRYL